MSKKFLRLDERGNRIVRQISSVLYIITVYSLIGFQLYRQFVLNPKVVRMRYLILGFTGLVIFGSAFTIFKYSVLLDRTLSMSLILDSFFMVLKISALLVGLWGLLAYLGNKRMEKRIS
jgi:hypothetical protein